VNGEIVGAIGIRGRQRMADDVDCARAALALVSVRASGRIGAEVFG